jgi:hypothetical protein
MSGPFPNFSISNIRANYNVDQKGWPKPGIGAIPVWNPTMSRL